MSVIFVVVPAVMVSWPILCGAIAGAAGALGFKALNSGKNLTPQENADTWVEVSMEGSQVVAEAMKRESEFSIGKDDVTATFRRAADGRCTVHVSGRNKTEQELGQVGRELVGRVTQQYAYNKVLSQLKNQGFTVTQEEVTPEQAIRIHVSKYV